MGLIGALLWVEALAGSSPARSTTSSPILLDSVLYDGYALDDADEAVRLVNVSDLPVTLAGWRLSDGVTSATIPSVTIQPGAGLWLTGEGDAFRFHFGHAADAMLDPWPGFSNSGDEVLLYNAAGGLADVLVYASGQTAQSGWFGPAVAPYRVSGVFAAEGQLLFRRRGEHTGAPVADTNSAADWGQGYDDPVLGRKVRYPGWEVERFTAPLVLTATATLSVAVAPDNAYNTLVQAIDGARESILLSSLTLENAGLGAALADAARRGVTVTALLEGAPPGGLTDQGRYVCGQIEAAGGACWYMTGDDARRVHSRYRYLHAKYLVIDSELSAISSENFSPDSLPEDDKADGTWGRRGVVLLTDAPGVATHLAAVFADDLDPAHADLVRWSADHPVYGAPPPGFLPSSGGGAGYVVRYPQPAVFHAPFRIELVQSPENSLRASDGLLGLLSRAVAGDTVRVQQLTERPFWGATTSNAAADPNPRLEAYLAAARRGATLDILLDSYFDDPTSATSNAAACAYVGEVARREGLNARCRTANPTGLGIHNKMVLARVGGRGYVYVGSINGTELSHKGNREVALLVQSDGAYAYLAGVAAADAPHLALLPVALAHADGPVNRVLISEIVYDTAGADDAEFVEFVNPTSAPIDLTGYALGDAVSSLDFEDMRHFPAGTILPAGGVVVVTLSATAFQTEFGRAPDFEIIDSDPAVPDLIDDPAWGDPAALFQLGNAGDEVLLIRWDGLVDVVTYGSGYHASVAGCGLLVPPARALERRPHWRDTDNCPADFRAWPFPSPGRVGE